MTRPSFNEQRDKIIQAYFKDEIQPFDEQFCFCGTLCDNSMEWAIYKDNCAIHKDFKSYKAKDFIRMENELLTTIHLELQREEDSIFSGWSATYNRGINALEGYEDALFTAMDKTLDVLKQIHIEGGEIIDEVPVFTKRNLVVA